MRASRICLAICASQNGRAATSWTVARFRSRGVVRNSSSQSANASGSGAASSQSSSVCASPAVNSTAKVTRSAANLIVPGRFQDQAHAMVPNPGVNPRHTRIASDRCPLENPPKASSVPRAPRPAELIWVKLRLQPRTGTRPESGVPARYRQPSIHRKPPLPPPPPSMTLQCGPDSPEFWADSDSPTLRPIPHGPLGGPQTLSKTLPFARQKSLQYPTSARLPLIRHPLYAPSLGRASAPIVLPGTAVFQSCPRELPAAAHEFGFERRSPRGPTPAIRIAATRTIPRLPAP